MRLAKRYVREFASDMMKRGVGGTYVKLVLQACENGMVTSFEAMIKLTEILKEWSGNNE